MLVTQQERLREQATELVGRLGPGRSSLIPVLQDVKRHYHGLDSDAMQIVADLLDIHPVEVYSVATFYAFLRPPKQGEQVIRLCSTVSCELSGKHDIARELESELGIRFGETTPDGRFTLEWTACMGLCDQGPALLVNETLHTRLTAASARDIVAELRTSAGERKEEYLV
jgi:NADH:ubiquinone oxidoreductase subunit E